MISGGCIFPPEVFSALEYPSQSLALFEEYGNIDAAAREIGNMGVIYHFLGDFQQALEYYSRAIAYYEEVDNKVFVAWCFGNIGELYSEEKFDGYDLEKAEENLLKCIALSDEIGDTSNNFYIEVIAALYRKQKRWEEADTYFQRFYTYEKEHQNQAGKKADEKFTHERREAEREKEIAVSKAKHEATEQLLHNVLPPSIANKMLDGTKLIAEKLPSVSVLFADIVNFTKLSQRITPEELVEGLDNIFTTFDILAEKHGLEKIKTIGDAYMVVSGAPIQRVDHAESMANFALEMVESMKEFRSISTDEEIQIRIGIHSGEVAAGVIGKKKFAYDLWGDAVNTASRMESHGEAGKIHCSEEFIHAASPSSFSSLLSLPSFTFQERGEMEIKGKGMMRTFYLENRSNQ
ncbi:MAG: tetratricopeptide repeat protein [Ignavibacteria bacterium]|nr:tetratricopeptide repeat protein [Ignavibacteria bacterium]